MKVNRGKKVVPRRMMLFGTHGIGKSTFANDAPKALFLNFEDGLNDLDCCSTDQIEDYAQVLEALDWLIANPGDFDWVVGDTADWLEGLIHDRVAKDAKKPFADIGFGNGPKMALRYWDEVIGRFDWLRTQCGIGTILTAHSDVKKFTPPDQESYDRYTPALNPAASAMLQEWCDEVFFVGYKVFSRKEDLGFNKDRNISIGDGTRFMRTQESPSCMAKNRLNMPSEVPFEWAEYAKFLPSVSA